jgi:Amino-transferase class IV
MKLGAQGARALIAGVLVVCGVWLVINEVRIVAFGNASAGILSSRWAHDVVLLASSGLCLARAARQPRQRAAWLLIGLGILAWSAGELYYTADLWNATSVPIPSFDDACCLLFYPLVLVGLVVLQRRRRGGHGGLQWADGMTTALSIGALSAVLLFQQVLTSDSGSPLAFATTLAYPLLDMILLAAVLGAMARRGWHLDRVWALLEAPTSSVFWVRDSELCTPPLSDHILASITRRIVIDATGAQERPCPLDELYAADEVFLASTVREVMPVVAVDDHAFEAPGPVSERTRHLVAERIQAQIRA